MTPAAIVTLQQHLQSALQSPPAEARRLLHGRGKCWAELEQITVDWLEDILLVTLFREPPAAELELLISMLRMPEISGAAATPLSAGLPGALAQW